MWNTSYYALFGCAYRDVVYGNIYLVDYQKMRPATLDTWGRLGMPTVFILGVLANYDFYDIIAKATAFGYIGSNATAGNTTNNYLMLYQVLLLY
jgi:hypothetical protein